MFRSSEAVLTKPKYMLQSPVYQENLVAFVVEVQRSRGKHSDESDVENQVADVIICILEIIAVFPKYKDMLNGKKVIYEKLGKMSAHCGSFELRTTDKLFTA